MSEFKTAQIWEDGLRTNPHKKSFEWWYFDANLDDGSTVVFTFFTKSPSHSSGPLAPSLAVTLTKPDGQKINFNQDFKASEFSASKEKCDVKMGPNSVSGNLKKYHIKVDMLGLKGELEFDRIAPSYSTASEDKSKPEYFGWFPAIPYGTVKGKLNYEGEEKSIAGYGYHDHNWGIIDLKDACDYWYWGRANAGDYSMIFSVMFLPKILGGKQGSILYLAKKDKMLIGDQNLVVKKVNINPPRPKEGHLPTLITFSYDQNGKNVEFSLTEPKLIEKSNPLNGQPPLKQFLTKLFSHPLYVRYNAKIELDVKIDGKKDSQKGNGIYEIMILH